MRNALLGVSALLIATAAQADGVIIIDGGGSEPDYVAQAPRFAADGRIFLLPKTIPSIWVCAQRVVALDPDGTLAAGFGQGGRLARPNECVIDLRPSADGTFKLRLDDLQFTDTALDPFWTSPKLTLSPTSTGNAALTAFARQPDGKFVLGGRYVITSMGGSPTEKWTLARLTTAGEWDPAFNAGALLQQSPSATTGFAYIASLHVLPNGQILASGRVQPDYRVDSYQTMLSRYNPNGTIDYSFGVNSELRLPDSTGQTVIDASDRLYVVGVNGHVTRLESNFAVDGTYAGGVSNLLVNISDIALDSAGRVVIFGSLDVPGGRHGYLARFDTAGSPDTTFNGTGMVDFAFSRNVAADCRGALQSDDKPVIACGVAGQADPNGAAPIDLGVARFTTSGAPDVTFGATQIDTDQYPDAFSFPTATVGFGAVNIESAPITVSGINTPAALRVWSASAYSIGCNGTWVAPANGSPELISDGQTLCVRRDAPGISGGTVSATVDIGGRVGTFTITATTSPADIVPDAFTFMAKTNVTRSALVESAAATISGLTGQAPIAVVNGEYSIGCTANYIAGSSTIQNGATVCLRHQSASGFAAATTTTLTIGGVQGTFTSTTVAADTTPEAFTFAPQTGVALGAVVISNTIAVTGLDSDTAMSITGGEYSVGCSGTFSAAAGTLAAGQSVCVRHTAANANSTVTHTTLTIGGVSADFSSTTLASSGGGSSSGGAAASSGGGGGGAFDLASLFALLLWVAHRMRYSAQNHSTAA